jgi:hypothetical protein
VVWLQNYWDGFSSVWTSKPMAMACEWFGLKTTRTVFAGLATKSEVTVSIGLASKPAAMVFTGLAAKLEVTVSSALASKPVAMVSLVWPQNQCRQFSPVWPQNWWRWFLLVWPQNRWSVSWLSLKIKVVEGFLVLASKPATLVW